MNYELGNGGVGKWGSGEIFQLSVISYQLSVREWGDFSVISKQLSVISGGEGRKKLIVTGYLLVIGIPNH